MSINQRIELLVEYEKSNLNFAKKTGLVPSTVSTLISKDASPPHFKNLMTIINAYPNLSLEWFLKGEGEIWKEEKLSGFVNEDQDGYSLDPMMEFIRTLKKMESRIDKLEQIINLKQE